MAIELGGIKLDKISRLQTLEQTTFVRFQVPGMEGELAQNLGRPSVRLRIAGIFYGNKAAERLAVLRKMHLAKEAVEFLADIVGKAFFALVILDRFEVVQDANNPDQFTYLLEVLEYKEPPKPVLLDFPKVNEGILQDAQQFMSAVLLPDQLDLPNIKDPTTPVKGMLTGVKKTLKLLDEEESTFTEIYGEN